MPDERHPGLPSRLEALEMAYDFLKSKGFFDVPMKPNGYPLDGWKPMSTVDQMFEVKLLADWLIENG